MVNFIFLKKSLSKTQSCILVLSFLFLFIPVILFLIGFTKWYVAIVGTCFIIYGFKFFINSYTKNQHIFNKKSYYAIVFLIIMAWVVFSGIGSLSYQNSDFNVRNAVLRDLINYDWPIFFDLSSIIEGVNKVGFVYYFTYWLPSAIIGKFFGITIANLFLVLSTVVYLFLIYMLLEFILKKSSYWILFFLIMFSGLDAIGNYLLTNDIISTLNNGHIEWWASSLQYSSNTTQLYWVFNQSIPIWMITCLLLLNKNIRIVGFLAATAFCYSPFATFGVIPFALYFLFHLYKKTKNIKMIFSLTNILYPLFILIVFGSFYLSADSSISIRGFIWEFVDWSTLKFIFRYLLFFCLEVGIYYMITFKKYKNHNLYKLTFLMLLLIPVYKMTPANDFCMRSSIMPLFIFMIFVINYFIDINTRKFEKMFIYLLVLCFASINPIHEISRSIHYTINLSRSEYLQEYVYSVANPIDEVWKEICVNQFYAKDINKNIFYKYFSK